jgi:hypothetical protein
MGTDVKRRLRIAVVSHSTSLLLVICAISATIYIVSDREWPIGLLPNIVVEALGIMAVVYLIDERNRLRWRAAAKRRMGRFFGRLGAYIFLGNPHWLDRYDIPKDQAVDRMLARIDERHASLNDDPMVGRVGEFDYAIETFANTAGIDVGRVLDFYVRGFTESEIELLDRLDERLIAAKDAAAKLVPETKLLSHTDDIIRSYQRYVRAYDNLLETYLEFRATMAEFDPNRAA